jgi:hypothetical protein
MSLEDAIKVVHSFGSPSSRTSVQEFEQALADLATAELTDTQLAQLFLGFSDSNPYQDVLWGLLRLIESTGESRYVGAYARQLDNLAAVASEWAETIACRILNTDRLDEALVVALRAAGDPAVRAFENVVRPLTTAKGPIVGRALRILDRIHRQQ